MQNLNQNSGGIVQSVSNPILSIPLNPCSHCSTASNLMLVVNYLAEESVEYFSFVVCLECRYESEGGGIFYGYYEAVLSAQEFWNTEQSEKPDGQKNPNKSE